MNVIRMLNAIECLLAELIEEMDDREKYDEDAMISSNTIAALKQAHLATQAEFIVQWWDHVEDLEEYHTPTDPPL